jgi:1-acyl-sn-glycerol-3-phosphate acyltransferase
MTGSSTTPASSGAVARRWPTALSYFGIAGMFCTMIGAGLVACAAQALSHALVRPLSRAAHRRVTVAFSRAFLLCGTVVLERWGRVRIVTHGDPIPPHSATLCILNHCSSVDMLIGLAWLSRYGPPYPGNAKAIVKASLGKVPIFGWILRFAEFPLISRSWEQDRLHLLDSIRSLLTFPVPLWYVIYPEGSRVDAAKLRASQDYARERGYPVLEHVLLPRFKAFTAVAHALRGSVQDVCDATLMFDGPIPTAKTALSGECSTYVSWKIQNCLILSSLSVR